MGARRFPIQPDATRPEEPPARRALRIAALAFGCLAAAGCAHGAVVTRSACRAADDNLHKLACDNGRGGHLGDPTLKGKPWVDLCLDDAANGIDLGPDCLARATSCAEANACVQ